MYLDSAASSQRPLAVLRAVEDYETHSHANVHRGVHALSQAATAAFEGARERVRRFINARSTREIIFVRGTTEAINLVAQAYGRPRFGPGDEILITALEHHANIVPWQMVLRRRPAARSGWRPSTAAASWSSTSSRRLLGPRTRLVAVAHVSNALGTVLPVKRIIDAAHAHGAVVLVDGAQAVPHLPVDVRALGCDFYAFSGHKLYGPTGIGVLYGREELLAGHAAVAGRRRHDPHGVLRAEHLQRAAVQVRGRHAQHVRGRRAGGRHGLSSRASASRRWPRTSSGCCAWRRRSWRACPDIELIGTAAHKASVLSFTMKGVHPHDLGTILDAEGVAVRTGHHCAMPVMTFFGIPATARASFGCYNTAGDVERLVAALRKAREVFG